MANVEYNISASYLGAGYRDTNFFLYHTDCGNPNNLVEVGGSNLITSASISSGITITVSDEVQNIFLVPANIPDARPFHCRLGCGTPGSQLTLTGYVPVTPEPTTPEPTTPQPAEPATPAPITPAPITPTPIASFDYETFGNMTISKTSSVRLQFAITNPSSYVRNGAATNLSYFLAGNQYVSPSTSVPITTAIKIFTSEQSILQDPECAYQYFDLGAYTDFTTSYVYWYDDPGNETTYVLVDELFTLPINFSSRTDSFSFLRTLLTICP